MAAILYGVVGVFVLLCLWFSAAYVVPVANRMFGLIWEDPTEKQRREALARLRELHIGGDVPAETAALMAAKELNTTEEELFRVLGTFSASDLQGLITGRRSGFSIALARMNRALKRRN